MKKKILSCFVLMFAFLTTFMFVTGCGPKEKTFTSPEGISVTLTTEFQELENMGVTYCVSSSKVVFMAQDETFEYVESQGYDSDMTVTEYAQLCVDNNNLDTLVLTYHDVELAFFEYNKIVEGEVWRYTAFVLKGSDAFWLCQFACEEAIADEYEPEIYSWADTIVVE